MKIITRTFCCILVLLLMLGSNVFAVSTPTMKGIDVSRHQGVINWDAVYGNTDFAIIRCGFGNDETSQDDTQWYNNANECMRLGIPFGVYIYSYATNTSMAESEANHVLRLVNGYNLSFPIYLDMEDNVQVVLSPGELGNIASTFCNIIQNAGYEVGIYANRNWWENHLTDAVFNNNLWHKWVAQYNSQCTYAGNYTMWQYTSSGNVNGINGRVDMNYWYGDLRGVSGDNNSVIVNTTIADTITSSNAIVRGTVSYSGNRPIEAGIYFGTSPDNMSKVARYTIEHNKNPFYMWYNLNSEAGQYLDEVTTYYWQCYAIVNGIETKGDIKSFTTINTNPTPIPTDTLTLEPTLVDIPELTPIQTLTPTPIVVSPSVLKVFSGNNPLIAVDNKIVRFPDAQPFIDTNNRTQIPIRAVAEMLKCDVEWIPDTSTVIITSNDGDVIILTIGNNMMIHNSNKVFMDTEALIKNDRTYIPVRFVAEALGLTVEWE